MKEVYASPYSKILFDEKNSLLVASWMPDSKDLAEKSVPQEIGKILDCIRMYPVLNIIVDTTNYYGIFRENREIQNWINLEFMPQIMDSEVRKYAIIISRSAKTENSEPGDGDHDGLRVEYFTNFEEAYKWIES